MCGSNSGNKISNLRYQIYNLDSTDKGDDWGLNNLGSMLLNGLGGLEKNHPLAVKCFNRRYSEYLLY